MAAAKRRFAKKQEIDVLIKIKGEDGQVMTFDEEEVEEPEEEVKVAPVKKAKKEKPIIEAEDTLAMIKQALGGGTFQTGDDSATPLPKKTTKKKTTKSKGKKIKSIDGIARFFNDYGESPHLQEIETSYLLFL